MGSGAPGRQSAQKRHRPAEAKESFPRSFTCTKKMQTHTLLSDPRNSPVTHQPDDSFGWELAMAPAEGGIVLSTRVPQAYHLRRPLNQRSLFSFLP